MLKFNISNLSTRFLTFLSDKLGSMNIDFNIDFGSDNKIKLVIEKEEFSSLPISYQKFLLARELK